jgi:UDP:flavonoid glycosyltransferase YjiC (YdhE family)
LDAILDQGEHHVVVLGESLLGKRLDVQRRRVRMLRDYPNGLYFKAFDYAVQAGGYNSFHEMRAIQMPTLFYPNLKTGMDDQLARCQVAEKEGWGLVVKNRTEKTIRTGIQRISAFMPTHEDKIQPNPHLDWLRDI